MHKGRAAKRHAVLHTVIQELYLDSIGCPLLRSKCVIIHCASRGSLHDGDLKHESCQQQSRPCEDGHAFLNADVRPSLFTVDLQAGRQPWTSSVTNHEQKSVHQSRLDPELHQWQVTSRHNPHGSQWASPAAPSPWASSVVSHEQILLLMQNSSQHIASQMTLDGMPGVASHKPGEQAQVLPTPTFSASAAPSYPYLLSFCSSSLSLAFQLLHFFLIPTFSASAFSTAAMRILRAALISFIASYRREMARQ
eukprot:1140048-Pelagomonas_calceolata.AAC.2